MAANPRKFSEKIALHKQKEAEETEAFERIMAECKTITQGEGRGGGPQQNAPAAQQQQQQRHQNQNVSPGQMSGACFAFPPPFPQQMAPLASGSVGVGYAARNPGTPIAIPGNGQLRPMTTPNFYHGSLPNVNAISGQGPHSIDLQSALTNLDELKDGRDLHNRDHHSRSSNRSGSSRNHSPSGPYSGGVDVGGGGGSSGGISPGRHHGRIDCSPYGHHPGPMAAGGGGVAGRNGAVGATTGGPVYLSPPTDGNWRRHHSDSALHDRADHDGQNPSQMPLSPGGQPLPSLQYPHNKPPPNPGGYWSGLPTFVGEPRRKSCDVPGINIIPFQETHDPVSMLSLLSNASPDVNLPSGAGVQGQIPISKCTGSLPDLTNLPRFPNPLAHHPLDADDGMSFCGEGSMSPLPGLNCGSSFSASPHGSASLSPTLVPPPLQRGGVGVGGPLRRSSGPAAHGSVPPPLVLTGTQGQASPMGGSSPTSLTNPLSPQGSLTGVQTRPESGGTNPVESLPSPASSLSFSPGQSHGPSPASPSGTESADAGVINHQFQIPPTAIQQQAMKRVAQQQQSSNNNNNYSGKPKNGANASMTQYRNPGGIMTADATSLSPGSPMSPGNAGGSPGSPASVGGVSPVSPSPINSPGGLPSPCPAQSSGSGQHPGNSPGSQLSNHVAAVHYSSSGSHHQQLQEHFQQFLPFQPDSSNLPRAMTGPSPNIFGQIRGPHLQGGSSPLSNERLQQFHQCSIYSHSQEIGFDSTLGLTQNMNAMNQINLERASTTESNLFYQTHITANSPFIDTGQNALSRGDGSSDPTSPSRMSGEDHLPSDMVSDVKMKPPETPTARDIPDIILTGADESQDPATEIAAGRRRAVDGRVGGDGSGDGGSSGGSATGDPDSDGNGENVHLDLSILPGGSKVDGGCNSILGCSPASSPGRTLLGSAALPTSSSPFDPDFFSSDEALKAGGLYQDEDSLLMGFGGPENEDLFKLDHPDKMICDK